LVAPISAFVECQSVLAFCTLRDLSPTVTVRRTVSRSPRYRS
jgi:hypothetical protein